MISLYQPGSYGGEMKCPTCGENTPDAWQKLKVRLGNHPLPDVFQIDVRGRDDSLGRDVHRIPDAWVVVDYMTCANWKCGELVMRMHETRPVSKQPDLDGELDVETQTWIIRPRLRLGADRLEAVNGGHLALLVGKSASSAATGDAFAFPFSKPNLTGAVGR